MLTRKIKVLTTTGISGTIETNVSTLGELKPLLGQKEINYSGMKMMIGETRNELSLDDAKLPEGDFKLYLMPQKTKSGGNSERAIEICYEVSNLMQELGDELLINSCTTKAPYEDKVDADVEDLRGITSRSSANDNWL